MTDSRWWLCCEPLLAYTPTTIAAIGLVSLVQRVQDDESEKDQKLDEDLDAQEGDGR